MTVVFLELIKLRNNYFWDSFNAAYTGDLLAAGHEARTLRYYLDPAADEATEIAAAARATAGADLVFIERVWTDTLPRALKAAGVGRVVVLYQPEWIEEPAVDHVLTRQRRASVLALAAGHAPETITDLWHKTPEGAPVAPTAAPAPVMSQELEGAALRFDQLVELTPDRRPPRLRKTLVGNLGCPYRLAPNPTATFDGVDLPTGVIAEGCTFCTRPAYEASSPDASLAVMLEQYDQLGEHFTKRGETIDDLIVLDDYAIRFADRLVEELQARGAAGTRLLFTARADYILKFRPVLERAVAAARSDNRVVLYLVGVENFSQAELDRFNKGLTVETLSRCLDGLAALAERNPAFEIEPAYGFILFTPWTTLADLRQNLAWFRRLGIERFRQRPEETRLRLYPSIPLYYLAKKDGLLAERFDSPEHSNAVRYGYEADVPWRFADPAVARLWALLETRRRKGDDSEALMRILEVLLAQAIHQGASRDGSE